MCLKENPCFYCNKREVGCHATCKSYKKWCFVEKIHKNQQDISKRKNEEFYDFKIDTINKNYHRDKKNIKPCKSR